MTMSECKAGEHYEHYEHRKTYSGQSYGRRDAMNA